LTTESTKTTQRFVGEYSLRNGERVPTQRRLGGTVH
jgi:hypothetical protein